MRGSDLDMWARCYGGCYITVIGPRTRRETVFFNPDHDSPNVTEYVCTNSVYNFLQIIWFLLVNNVYLLDNGNVRTTNLIEF